MKRRVIAVLALAAVLVVAYAVVALARSHQASRTVSHQASRTVTIRMAGNPQRGFRFTGVPRNLTAGQVTFRFRNTSAAPIRHNFTVVRTFGAARPFRSATVDAGQTATRTVNVRAGTYVALCTVFNGGHAANGMLVAFQVGT